MRYIDEYLPVFKAKNKNKMRKDNQLCQIEIREVDNEKKRIKKPMFSLFDVIIFLFNAKIN